MTQRKDKKTDKKTADLINKDWEKIADKVRSGKENGEEYALELTRKLLGWLGESYQVDVAHARYLGTPEQLKEAEENYKLVSKSGWFVKWKWQNSYEGKQHRQPPRDFEKANNLKDVAGHYVMPEGRSAKEWEEKVIQPCVELTEIFDLKENFSPERQQKLEELKPVRQKKLGELNKVLDSFIKVNPQLKEVPVKRDDFTNVWDTLMGVTSDFNVDDISYFISTTSKERHSPEAKKRKADLNKRLKMNLGWRASPKTMTKIEQQLDRQNTKTLQAVKAKRQR